MGRFFTKIQRCVVGIIFMALWGTPITSASKALETLYFIKRIIPQENHKIRLGVDLTISLCESSARTKKIVATVTLSAATVAAFIKLYPIYRDWQTRRSLPAVCHAAETSSLTIGGGGLLSGASGPIMQLILQYAARPVNFRIEIPQDTDPFSLRKPRISKPTILKNGDIQVTVTYYIMSNLDDQVINRAINHAFKLNTSGLLLNHEPITTRELAFAWAPEQQDVVLSDGRRCLIHFEQLPTATEPGVVVGSLFDANCHLLAREMAQQKGISLEVFFAGNNSVPTWQPYQETPTLPAPASSSGTTESQIAHQKNIPQEGKEEKK